MSGPVVSRDARLKPPRTGNLWKDQALDDALRRAALAYHEFGRPGKLSVEPTKPMATQRDLALAYSPGVAAACEAIVENPDMAERPSR